MGHGMGHDQWVPYRYLSVIAAEERQMHLLGKGPLMNHEVCCQRF